MKLFLPLVGKSFRAPPTVITACLLSLNSLFQGWHSPVSTNRKSAPSLPSHPFLSLPLARLLACSLYLLPPPPFSLCLSPSMFSSLSLPSSLPPSLARELARSLYSPPFTLSRLLPLLSLSLCVIKQFRLCSLMSDNCTQTPTSIATYMYRALPEKSRILQLTSFVWDILLFKLC